MSERMVEKNAAPMGSHEGSDGVAGNGPVDPLEGDLLGVAWVAIGVPRYYGNQMVTEV